jgi:hypothetical protein
LAFGLVSRFGDGMRDKEQQQGSEESDRLFHRRVLLVGLAIAGIILD